MILQEDASKISKTSNVPTSDIDLGKVVTDVSAAWALNPAITLIWMDQTKFNTNAVEYNTELALRMQLGGDRPQITQALKMLDKKIDENISYVKELLIKKYKKENAPSYYPAFGIYHKKDKYVMPTDKNNRLASLKLMLGGLVQHGFGADEYGTAFWTPIHTQYEILLGQATTTDGNVSDKVSNKNSIKKELDKTLRALINILKGNYPDTYKSVLRTWGFQKEKY